MFTKWQIFLFDFDGTLVNSEAFHHQAYIQVAREYGIPFAPNFVDYTRMAHFSDHALRDVILEMAPHLDWTQFYAAKKRAYLEILETSKPQLMEGVASLLERLKESKTVSCVVTHSAKEQTERFCELIPLLRTIDYWITREDYQHPKPAADAYQVALAKVKKKKEERVVGFEDSIRGLHALFGIEADRFLVSNLIASETINELRSTSPYSFTHIPSFTASGLV